VEPVAERVVFDRNRVTGAGVTSGIDFALALVAHLFGEDRASRILLSMEYDPEPPLRGGSLASAADDVVAAVRATTASFQAEREEVARRVAATLRTS
jgi:cyclohexyl-isocyanide hydratase